jgi:N-acetylglutamate synthase-like GNAT family acetyltransferase
MGERFRVRRATSDDLQQLTALWESNALPASRLEKRFTEFQLAEDADGRILGAIGLQMVAQQGKLHSESFADFALADALRPLLWQRLQSVANNHGLFRLWTQETAPFWTKSSGFVEAGALLVGTLPELFREPRDKWLVLQLREETSWPASIEREFTRLREEEQARTQRLMGHARTMKNFAFVLAVLLFMLVLAGGAYLLHKRMESGGP